MQRSLQHDIFEVFLQDGVLHGVEDKADIFCVYRSGEVVEKWLPPVSPLTTKQLHQERLEEAEGQSFYVCAVLTEIRDNTRDSDTLY